MGWVTAIWAILIGAYAAVALPNLFVGIWQRRAADLFFVGVAVGTVGLATAELGMMYAISATQYAEALRWIQAPIFLLYISIIGFVRLYFGTGRLWLGITTCAARFACLILNFVSPVNLAFTRMTGLDHVQFFGDTVAVGRGVANPWVHLTELSALLMVAFVTDASISLWQTGKEGHRRRAVTIGGSIVFFVLAAQITVVLSRLQITSSPYPVSLWFFPIVAFMALELGYDLFAAANLARKLQLSEASLSESEQRFGIVADSTPILIWMSGMDKLCTFFNKAWLEFTGRTMEQEMGNGWVEGVHPDDLQKCLQTYTAAFDAREPFVMQYRLRRYDGEYRWIQDDGVPRYDAQKAFTGYIGSCVDITESISKEQALRDSEERMSLAVDAAHIGLWEWDVTADELWGTPTRRTLLGLPDSEKIKLEDALLRVHADDRDNVRQMLHDAARTGKDYHCEYRVVLADGSVRWTEHRGRCLRTKDANDLILRGVSIDVTEQKRAEQKFRLAVEASPSGILLVDEKGQIVLVNSQIEKLFGYGREELMGHHVEILVPERFAGQHPEHRAKYLAAPTARSMGAGRELFGRRKDGSEFPVEIGLNPIQTPEGTIVLAAVVDISARKGAEAEAQRHREEVAHLSRVAALGELTASIAHELNQPLSGIISNASAGQRFINRGNVDLGELRELLADIVADGRRAGEVIRGIRSMVKKSSRVRQPVNFNDLVTNVVRMVRPDATLRSCQLNTLLEPNLPSIEGDPIQLQQILLNLLTNALDAMGETPLSRRQVVIVTERNGDGTIGASVRDYGSGIPAEVRERLFDHFFTTKAEGMGMGLAIVRSIVESHRGTITAENIDGGGARFHFTLPVNVSGDGHSTV